MDKKRSVIACMDGLGVERCCIVMYWRTRKDTQPGHDKRGERREKKNREKTVSSLHYNPVPESDFSHRKKAKKEGNCFETDQPTKKLLFFDFAIVFRHIP